MLEGPKVNLKHVERGDLELLTEWANNPEFSGDFEPFEKVTLSEMQRWYEGLKPAERWFIIEKKDGSKIGQIYYKPIGSHFQIGLRLIPGERGRGYGTEAVMMIVDHLFLTKDIVKVQAECNPKNMASLRILEKAGFKQEGLIRKSVFINGQWMDGAFFGILREDWKTPKVPKTAPR